MDDERWGHPTRLRALLQGEMTLLILLATPTPTRRVPAQLALSGGEWPLSLRSGACAGGRAPRGRGRRLDVPGQLRHKAAPCRIGLRELVLLRGRQTAPQIFDGTAQFNKHVIGQRVLTLPDRQGIEGLG
jgi:hypothetical protein